MPFVWRDCRRNGEVGGTAASRKTATMTGSSSMRNKSWLRMIELNEPPADSARRLSNREKGMSSVHAVRDGAVTISTHNRARMKTRTAASSRATVKARDSMAFDCALRQMKVTKMARKMRVKKHWMQRPANRMELAPSGVYR